MTHGVVSQDEEDLLKAVFDGEWPRDAGERLNYGHIQ